MANNNLANSDDRKAIKFISLTSDILSICTVLISIASTLGLFNSILNNKNLIIWVLVVLFAVISTTIIIKFRSQISTRLLYILMNLTAPRKDYRMSRKVSIMEYFSRTEMRHEKQFCPIVLSGSLDGVCDQFKWTGDQALTPVATYPANQKIEMMHKKFGMQHYKIFFNNGVNYVKGEKVPLLAMHIDRIYDPKKISSPHLSSGVYEVTDCLVLRVIFDSSIKIENSRKLTYYHYSDTTHVRSEAIELCAQTNGKNILEWEIARPIYGGKYVIDWNFCD